MVTVQFFHSAYVFGMLGRKSTGMRNAPLSEKLKSHAWDMRNVPTTAEKILWESLRLRRLDGFRFRRQHILGGYIADFFCHEANLVIEVDGEIHLSQKEYDAARDRVMREMGATILRIPNACVLNDIEEAKRRIREYLSVPPSGVRGNEASRGDNSPAHAGRA